MRHCGDKVSVYDRHGRFDCRGTVISRYYGMDEHYDIQTDGKDMLRQIPAARLKAYIPVEEIKAKYIYDCI